MKLRCSVASVVVATGTVLGSVWADVDSNTAIDKISQRLLAGDAQAREQRAARRCHRLDISNDGLDDVICLLTLEGFAGGNGQSFFIAALVSRAGKQQPLPVLRVGSTGERLVSFARVSVHDGVVLVDTKEYLRDNSHFDADCCPSKVTQARFAVQGGRLVEVP